MEIKRVIGKPGRSQLVNYNGVVHTVATADDKSLDMKGQTEQVLAKIEKILADNGSDKSRLLTAMVYITDMSLKAEMDQVFVDWVHPDGRPTRACVQAGLADGSLVEIVVSAAA